MHHPPPLSQASKNLRGIFAMAFAMACFVVNDTCVKYARETLETGQILIVRGVISLVLLSVWLQLSGVMRATPMLFHRQILLRGVIEVLIAISFITALGAMALADITAILLLSPLFITIISILFLGEKVGWRRWLAILAGFCGMLLVIRPEGQSSLIPVLLAIFCAFGVAVRDTLTYKIPEGIPNLVISLSTTLGTIIGGGMLVAGTQIWAPIEKGALFALTGAAFFIVIGNVAIIRAFRGVELSVVSPFRYSVILWAVLLGGFVFGQWPDIIAFAGIGLIGASGVYTLHRENMRRRQEKTAASQAVI